MELWIRSQDKTKLVKVTELYIDIPADFGKSGFGVYTKLKSEYNHVDILGIYKTKERASEVLDEIQNIFRPKGILKVNCILDQEAKQEIFKKFDNQYEIIDKNIEVQQVDTYVYEMPEE